MGKGGGRPSSPLGALICTSSFQNLKLTRFLGCAIMRRRDSIPATYFRTRAERERKPFLFRAYDQQSMKLGHLPSICRLIVRSACLKHLGVLGGCLTLWFRIITVQEVVEKNKKIQQDKKLAYDLKVAEVSESKLYGNAVVRACSHVHSVATVCTVVCVFLQPHS